MGVGEIGRDELETLVGCVTLQHAETRLITSESPKLSSQSAVASPCGLAKAGSDAAPANLPHSKVSLSVP